MSRFSFAVFCGSIVLLAGCALRGPAFPVTLPPQSVIDSDYMTMTHNLSSLKKYHFEMLLPRGWQTLDTKISAEPKEGSPQEVGVFRQSGAWMHDPSVLANGEISVTVLKTEEKVETAEQAGKWLVAILNTTTPGYKLLKQRTTGTAADMLIRYGGGGEDVIARFWAVPSSDQRVFVVTGSAAAKEYPDLAEEIYAALSTFRLLR